MAQRGTKVDTIKLRNSDKPQALMIMPSRLGDAVLATPVLRQLNKYAVTLVVDPLVQDLFDASPMVTQRISLPKEKHSLHWLKLRLKLKGIPFKRVIDLRGSWLSYTWPFAERSIWGSQYKHKRHKVEQVCACAEMPLEETFVWTNSSDFSFKPDLILAPAANWVGKQWPAEKFRELAERFLETYPHAHVAYICAPHEAQLVEHIWKDLPRSHPICDGNLSLGQIASLFRQAKVFVGNDSGLMHLAVATQLPTIALFGPTNDIEYGPFEKTSTLHCVVRGKPYEAIKSLPHFSPSAHACFMNDLSVEDVWQALQQRSERAFAEESCSTSS